MSQAEKSRYFQALKAAGVTFSRHYREYTTEELRTAYYELQNQQPTQPEAPEPAQPADPEAAAFFGYAEPETEPPPVPTAGDEDFSFPSAPEQPDVPEHLAVPKDTSEMPGQRLNTQSADEPIRIERNNEGQVVRIWYQEEVLKPATPRPRGRRVLQYTDTGASTETRRLDDGTIETFEVAGNMNRTAEVKITLPSYQVGIYRDPRFPFKVHTYAGKNGFDLFEVQEFYGGPELVPSSIKRIYVSNVLCYDIRTTVRTIEAEHRQLQLQGRI